MAPLWTQAAPPPLPTRPLPTYTPSPIPSPTPTITPALASQSSSIILNAQSAAALEWDQLWTAVEWQTEDGGWQTVEGWQGAFDSIDTAGGRKTWSVPPTLFGRGPFRWRVDAAQNGPLLAASQPFNLPERAGVRQVITLTLPAAPAQPILLPTTGDSIGWLGATCLILGLPLLWQIPKRLKRH